MFQALGSKLSFGQFDQDAGGRFGMQKGDPLPVGTGTRRLVDEPVARRAAALQRRLEVGDVKAEMVDAGAAGGEELADRAGGIRGG